MKYLKKFETEADKNAWREGSEFVTPNVVLTDGQVEYNVAIDPSTLPLYIEAINDLTIKFGNLYQYSKDKSTWLSGTSSTSISANAGEKVYFRASGLTPSSSNGIGTFTISGNCNVGGNVMSMIYGADFKGQKVITSNYQFNRLFNQCTTISDASSLVLPATTLTEYCYLNMFGGCTSLVNAPALPATALAERCYNSMFSGCTSLVNAPALPATTLANYCYSNMFSGCTSLVNAPALPATTLANLCYYSMFSGCTSLVNAPALPATTLTSNCYYFMFSGCTSLVNAPALPATTLADLCYYFMFSGCTSLVNAPALPATTLANYCYYSMFSGCTSLVNAPALPATTLTNLCYYSMFSGCTSLVNAPALPATTLTSKCYYSMFSGCSSLNHIKAMFTTSPGSTYTSDWVNGVAAEGTFVKNRAATWTTTGVSGIPTGWTVELADA